ncbi:unnamed protein product, partial [Rotaria sp. Silwood2]
MLFIVIVIFAIIGVNSLPPINFTDTVLTNRMIEALSEALVAHDEPRLTPFYQLRQHLKQQQSKQQQSKQQQSKEQQLYQPQLPEQQQQQFY